MEAFLKAEDEGIPPSEILKIKKSLRSVSSSGKSSSSSREQEELDEENDDELNPRNCFLKSKAKYVTSSKSFDPSYGRGKHETPSKYNQNKVTSTVSVRTLFLRRRWLNLRGRRAKAARMWKTVKTQIRSGEDACFKQLSDSLRIS